jgi:hypothetical protein
VNKGEGEGDQDHQQSNHGFATALSFLFSLCQCPPTVYCQRQRSTAAAAARLAATSILVQQLAFASPSPPLSKTIHRCRKYLQGRTCHLSHSPLPADCRLPTQQSHVTRNFALLSQERREPRDFDFIRRHMPKI